MSMLKRNRWLRVSLATSGMLAGFPALDLQAVENRSLLIFTTSANEVPRRLTTAGLETNEDSSLAIKTVQSEKANTTSIVDSEAETVRERFPNGRKRIEKQVALDAKGDFKNHGRYEEWSVNGEIVSTGSFEMGLRQGPWTKLCRSQDAKLFETYPYSKFKSPFQSTVNFASDKMDGVWMLIDADKRIVSQISLADGVREGISTWFHPNGKVLYQAEYKNGVLDGMFVEKDQDEKIVRNEQYTQGRVEVEQEFYDSKMLKSEISYLTASPAVVSQDDWLSSMLAVYDQVTDKIKHGNFQSYFENAQLKSKGTYERGVLVGEFESYFSNGQKESAGSYASGKQNGKWTWWHTNGMPATSATFSEGKIAGEVLAWDESGKRVTEANATEQRLSRKQSVTTPRQATSSSNNR